MSFSINTNLTMPSHLSAWAIDRWLAAHTPLPPLGSAFKAAETTYGVNAEYLVAHAMEETAFGTSYIAQAFRNLFGWNAIDADPVGNASHFGTYEQSIDFVAERVATLYLSPTGAFYGGAPTLAGMSRYASGPLWAANIARIADQMETELPTLAGMGVVLGPPAVDPVLHTGGVTTVTIGPASGAAELPGGLRAAYRFVPLVLVPETSAVSTSPTAPPPFVQFPTASTGGTVSGEADTPTVPGTYRLEVELLDSDGTGLTEPGFQSLVSIELTILAPNAVSYDLNQHGNDLVVSVANVGGSTIPASLSDQLGVGAVVSGAPSDTVLVAWLVGTGDSVRELFRVPVVNDLAPGGVWTVRTPIAPFADLLPGVVAVRLLVAGDAGAVDGSIPGLYSLAPTTMVVPRGVPPIFSVRPLVPLDLTLSHAMPGTPATLSSGSASASVGASVDPVTSALVIQLTGSDDTALPPLDGRTRPTSIDGLLNGAGDALPKAPSVLVEAVPLIGSDTQPLAAAVPFGNSPDEPQTATASYVLPSGQPAAGRSVYLVSVQFRAASGFEGPDPAPFTAWVLAPAALERPVEADPPDSTDVLPPPN